RARWRRRPDPRRDSLHAGRIRARGGGAGIAANDLVRDLERTRARLLDRGAHSDQEIVLLEQLSSTLEELRVVQEDLHEQNAYLLEMRSRIESERRRYLELFELAPDAYLVTDAHGLVLEANRSAGALFGVG